MTYAGKLWKIFTTCTKQLQRRMWNLSFMTSQQLE